MSWPSSPTMAAGDRPMTVSEWLIEFEAVMVDHRWNRQAHRLQHAIAGDVCDLDSCADGRYVAHCRTILDGAAAAFYCRLDELEAGVC